MTEAQPHIVAHGAIKCPECGADREHIVAQHKPEGWGWLVPLLTLGLAWIEHRTWCCKKCGCNWK